MPLAIGVGDGPEIVDADDRRRGRPEVLDRPIVYRCERDDTVGGLLNAFVEVDFAVSSTRESKQWGLARRTFRTRVA